MIHNPAILTVESAQAVFHREWPPRVEITGIDFKAAVEVIPVDTFCPPIANFLLQPATGEVEPALVEKVTALVRGRHPDHHGCGVGHSAKARLTLPDEVHPRAPFREQHRQKHERESGCDEEQLERQHVLGRTVRGERPAPLDGAGDRQTCDDQDARIESDRAESRRRPEKERQGQIDQCGDAAFGCNRPVEDADADRDQPAADQERLDDARTTRVPGTGTSSVDPGKDRRSQHQVCEGLGKKPGAPVEPIALCPAGKGPENADKKGASTTATMIYTTRPRRLSNARVPSAKRRTPTAAIRISTIPATRNRIAGRGNRRAHR